MTIKAVSSKLSSKPDLGKFMINERSLQMTSADFPLDHVSCNNFSEGPTISTANCREFSFVAEVIIFK